MKSIVRALATAAIAVAPAVCVAQIVRVEVYPIQSVTMSDQDFLNARKDAKPVTLATIKADAKLKSMVLAREPRLSVQPVSAEEWKTICRMGGVKG